MFEQTFVDGTAKTHKTWTVLLSFLGQVGLICVADIDTADLYGHAATRSAHQLPGGATATAAASSASSAARARRRLSKVIPRQFDAGKLMAPKTDSERDREH